MTGNEERTLSETDGLSMTGNAAGRSHLQSQVRGGVCGGNNVAHGFGPAALLCAGGVGGREAWWRLPVRSLNLITAEEAARRGAHFRHGGE